MVTRTVAKNVIWNWAGMGTNMLAGFVVAPFLVHRLGQTVYGLWILVASLIYYFGLLDLGICGAVGRQLAFHRAKGDRQGMNSTLSTALAILTGAGLLALIGTLGVMVLFFKIFNVPPEQVADVRLSLLLVGLNLMVWLPLNTFNATLWACQRFDLINITDICSVSTRVALTFYFVSHGYGLVALGLINLITLSGGQAIKGIIALRIDPGLRISPTLPRKDAAKALMGIGFWNSILMLAGVVNGQLGSLVVGSRLAVQLVTAFSVATRLMGYGRDFLVASTGVLTPVAVSFHAEEKHDQQQRLVIYGGKYCLTIAIFFILVLTTLGTTIIKLWMGSELEWAGSLLVIIALGEALPLSQWVSYSTILGQYRHRALACAAIFESGTAILLAMILVKHYGMTGVCIGIAIPATLCRGCFQMFYACKLVKLPVTRYLGQVMLPVLSAAALPALGLIAAVQWKPPENWLELMTYTGVFGLALVILVVLLTESEWVIRSLGQRLAQTIVNR